MVATTKTIKKTVKKVPSAPKKEPSASKGSPAEKWLKAYLKARHSKPEDRSSSREELSALEAELLKTL